MVSDTKNSDDNIEQYIHNDKKRAYNPPVGLVTPQTDKDLPKKQYSYDPHLDPQLIWSGKKENTNFEVDTVSLHVHERIDPITIIENVMKNQKYTQQTLFHYFELPENNLPNRQAIEFYKHDQNWSNRLIAGDSLLVMNSLLQKENMSEKIQMIYIDPPYGIKYGSNFQPFTNKREVTDGKDEDLTQEPEMIKAFRDTWELGIHSYLIYLRDRLLLTKELLSDTGSCFVQIGEENVHLIRCLMDEIFGTGNFISQISVFKQTAASSFLDNNLYYLIWYAKNKATMHYHQLFMDKPVDKWARDTEGGSWGVTIDGVDRPLTPEEKSNTNLLPKGAEIYQLSGLTSPGAGAENPSLEIDGKKYFAGERRHWSANIEAIKRLVDLGRIETRGDKPWFKKYHKDFPYKRMTNVWSDTSGKANERIYVVQTQDKVIERCVLMTTKPGDLVFDPTCGSGITAYISERWGRRWITCDTSRVAIAIAKQRLLTSSYKYHELAHPQEGLTSDFKYKKIPHVTMSALAYDEPPKEEILYDQTIIDKSKIRISGPYTVEAVPAPVVRSSDTISDATSEPDQSVVRSGESLRQQKWRDELLHTGIRGKGGQKIEFSRVEILPGTQWLHADAETKENDPKRVVVSFGSDYAPLEMRQVANALEEAQHLIPKPKIVLFAAFQFDPEASKDIDETNWPGVMLLKAQMNGDLFTDDLKKKKSTNESFWLVGQPDIELKKQKDGKYVIEVKGFDYYNTKSGDVESGDSTKIAMWMLDTDYDSRSLYPRQIFFPMSGTSDGWSDLAKTLRAEIDKEKIEQYRGTISLPFDLGINKKIAVKIIDDRGIESLRIIRVQ